MEYLKDWFADLWDDIKESCRGKSAGGRLIFWGWLVYLSIQIIRNPDYYGLIGGLNLGIHEFGHLICGPLGQFIGILGGSLVQCLVPVISIFMFWRQRDFFAWAFSLVWLGTNLNYVAYYIADARKLQLELVSPFGGGGDGPIHDWNWLLNEMNLLTHEQEIAQVVRGAGIAVSVLGVIWGAWIIWQMFRAKPLEEKLPFEL